VIPDPGPARADRGWQAAKIRAQVQLLVRMMAVLLYGAEWTGGFQVAGVLHRVRSSCWYA